MSRTWPARFCFGFVKTKTKTKTFCFDRSKYHCKTKKSFALVLVLPKTKTKHKIVQVSRGHLTWIHSWQISNFLCEIQFNWESSGHRKYSSEQPHEPKVLKRAASWTESTQASKITCMLSCKFLFNKRTPKKAEISRWASRQEHRWLWYRPGVVDSHSSAPLHSRRQTSRSNSGRRVCRRRFVCFNQCL